MRFAAALLLPALAAATPVALDPPTRVLDGRWQGPPTGSPAAAPSGVTISSVSFSGNGCPQNSVSTSISTDKTVVTFGFDSFQTYIGPGTSVSDHTKNCQLHLNLLYPSGFTFAVVDATYHGYAQLDSGVSGTFLSTYYFSQDASATATTQTTITGGGVWANGQVYTKDDQVPTASFIWSPCGANGILNVNNRIALSSSSSSASGEVTDDDATISFTHQVHLSWYHC